MVQPPSESAGLSCDAFFGCGQQVLCAANLSQVLHQSFCPQARRTWNFPQIPVLVIKLVAHNLSRRRDGTGRAPAARRPSRPPANCRLWALVGLSTGLRASITDSLRMRRTARPVSFCTGLRKEKPPAAANTRQMVSFTETGTFFRFLSLFSVLLRHNRHIWCSREECAYITWTLQGKCDARGRRGEGERSEYGRREDHV